MLFIVHVLQLLHLIIYLGQNLILIYYYYYLLNLFLILTMLFNVNY
jgi:hypothetical protein